MKCELIMKDGAPFCEIHLNRDPMACPDNYPSRVDLRFRDDDWLLSQMEKFPIIYKSAPYDDFAEWEKAEYGQNLWTEMDRRTK